MCNHIRLEVDVSTVRNFFQCPHSLLFIVNTHFFSLVAQLKWQIVALRNILQAQVSITGKLSWSNDQWAQSAGRCQEDSRQPAIKMHEICYYIMDNGHTLFVESVEGCE